MLAEQPADKYAATAMTTIGIDVGTTAIKSCVVDTSGNCLASESQAHNANVGQGDPDHGCLLSLMALRFSS